MNALKTKENHFGILYLNIVSLNKHVDGLSSLLSLMIIGLSEHKIGLNTPINNISLPGYTFSFDETKSTHGGTGLIVCIGVSNPLKNTSSTLSCQAPPLNLLTVQAALF